MDTRFTAATGVDDERSVAVAVYPVGTPIADEITNPQKMIRMLCQRL